jgi:hypothetical protein
MHDALTARFTDADEIKDVANYGCAGGVNGFIYYSETSKFFDEYEAEIYDYLNDAGFSMKNFVHSGSTISTSRMILCGVLLRCTANVFLTNTSRLAKMSTKSMLVRLHLQQHNIQERSQSSS